MRILKIVAIIVGVLIVIAIAIPLFIDANTFRPEMENGAHGRAGAAGEGGKSFALAVLRERVGGQHFDCG